MYTIVLRKFHENHLNRAAVIKISELRCRLYKITKNVSHLETISKSIITSTDFVKSSKLLMDIHKQIGESILSIQDFSISSSRVMGLEIGLLRIILPWNINLNVGRTQNKKTLDVLLHDLEECLTKCALIQNVLSNMNNVHSPQDINLVDLSYQSEWSSEILIEVIGTLRIALDENLDALQILQSLVEWDYDKRYTVGESDLNLTNDENNNSVRINIKEIEESCAVEWNNISYSHNDQKYPLRVIPITNRRWVKSFILIVIICSGVIITTLYLFNL